MNTLTLVPCFLKSKNQSIMLLLISNLLYGSYAFANDSASQCSSTLPISHTAHTSHKTRTLHPPISQETRQKKLQELNCFEARGKVSFTQGKKGGNAAFEWNQSQAHYSILLMGALGIAAVRINHDGHEVTLTSSRGEKYAAKTAEQLIKQSLGWQIPVTPLVYWLRGIPAPGKAPSLGMLDSHDRLVVLEQQGWKISYQSYINVSGIELPQKILLEHGNIRLRFIFKKWVF